MLSEKAIVNVIYRGRRGRRGPTQEAELLNALQEEIRQEIEERWRNYFPCRAESPAPDVTCPKAADSRGYSVLFEYRLAFPNSKTADPIIAKIRRESHLGDFDRKDVTKALALGRTEFDELSKAYQHFRSRKNGLGVIRPIDYLDEYNAVLVEKASGCDLALLVKDRPPSCLIHFTRCGQWLRAFHNDVHQSRCRTWEASHFEAGLTRATERLLARGVSKRKLDPLVHSVLKSARLAYRQDVPYSTLHGDFKLRHVWATSEAIQVLDFGNTGKGDCYRDVAAFLIELAVLSLAQPWYDTRSIDAYSKAFLAGYFSNESIPAVLPFYLIDRLLNKWDRRLTRWSRYTPTLRIQKCLRWVRATPVFDRLYLDRWFAGCAESLLHLAKGY